MIKNTNIIIFVYNIYNIFNFYNKKLKNKHLFHNISNI